MSAPAGRRPYTRWTEAQREELRALWAGPLATVAIARHFGVEISAVCNMASRLQLGRRDHLPRLPRKGAAATQVARERTVMPEPMPPAAPAGRAAAGQRGLPASEGCRWPLWGHRDAPDGRHCGAARRSPESPYCAAHAARAYERPPPRGPQLPHRNFGSGA